MARKDKKFITQEIFNSLISASTTGKTKQIAVDLSVNGRKKLTIEAAVDDITPSEKARQVLGLMLREKIAPAKLTIRLSEEDYRLLALKYGVDRDDKLTIRDRVAEELAEKYPDEELQFIPTIQWP